MVWTELVLLLLVLREAVSESPVEVLELVLVSWVEQFHRYKYTQGLGSLLVLVLLLVSVLLMLIDEVSDLMLQEKSWSWRVMEVEMWWRVAVLVMMVVLKLMTVAGMMLLLWRRVGRVRSQVYLQWRLW